MIINQQNYQQCSALAQPVSEQLNISAESVNGGRRIVAGLPAMITASSLLSNQTGRKCIMAKISRGANLVYEVLKQRPQGSGWITQKALAEATDLSLEEVRIGIEDLIEGPLSDSPMIIEKRINDRGASEYHLIDEAQVVENILRALEEGETMTPDQLAQESGLSLAQVEEGLVKLLDHGVGDIVKDIQPQTVYVPAFRTRIEEDGIYGYDDYDY